MDVLSPDLNEENAQCAPAIELFLVLSVKSVSSSKSDLYATIFYIWVIFNKFYIFYDRLVQSVIFQQKDVTYVTKHSIFSYNSMHYIKFRITDNLCSTTCTSELIGSTVSDVERIINTGGKCEKFYKNMELNQK